MIFHSGIDGAGTVDLFGENKAGQLVGHRDAAHAELERRRALDLIQGAIPSDRRHRRDGRATRRIELTCMLPNTQANILEKLIGHIASANDAQDDGVEFRGSGCVEPFKCHFVAARHLAHNPSQLLSGQRRSGNSR